MNERLHRLGHEAANLRTSTGATKWDLRFLTLAQLVGSWSKDPSTQVGCVIARPDHTVASLGFNGFPKGVQDRPEHYRDREFKYPRIVHAEANAIVHATESLRGYSLYVYPLLPCGSCAGLIIQRGISEVITSLTGDADTVKRWKDQAAVALEMFRDAGVEVYNI